MQLWIVTVVILFALSQLWDWLNNTEFSLPVMALAGLGLAIASNYDKRSSFPFWPAASNTNPSVPSPTIVTVSTPTLTPNSAQAVALNQEAASQSANQLKA